MAMRLDAEGRVRETKVVKSSMYARLDRAAAESLALCRFRPQKVDGKPQPGWIKVAYKWTLEGAANPVRDPFASAPAPIREFVSAARNADRLTDPLERCLAMPDYPGSQWPAAVVKARCERVHAASVTLAQVEQHLREGRLEALDKLYRRDLDLHFASQGFSEAIHIDFHPFETSADAARISAAWIKAAPASAFAQTARGLHLVSMAGDARGGAYADKTSDAQFAQMNALLLEAYGFLRQATLSEPRMLPALEGMIWGAMMGSDDEGRDDAIRRAAAVDPGCFDIARLRLRASAPRWGGSHDEMHAYAASLQPLTARRPLLATLMHPIEEDRARSLRSDKQYGAIAALLEPAARAAPSRDVLDALANATMRLPGQRWAALAALLSAQRFAEVTAESAEERGRQLFNAGDYAWSVAPLQQAVDGAGKSGESGYLLGISLFNIGEAEQAIARLDAALRADPRSKFAQSARYKMLMARIELQDWNAARTEAGAYTSQYPDDAFGWLQHGRLLDLAGSEGAADLAVAKFRELAAKQGGLRFERDLEALKRYLQGPRGRGAAS